MLHLLAGMGADDGFSFAPVAAGPAYRCPPGTSAIATNDGAKCRGADGRLTEPVIAPAGSGGSGAPPLIIGAGAGIGSMTPYLVVAGLALAAWFFRGRIKRLFGGMVGKKRRGRRGRR